MGLEQNDLFLTLSPRSEWTKAKTQAELTEHMAVTVGQLPGLKAIFTQPIELRVNEMVAGVRTDVGIKVFGDDLDLLLNIAAQIKGVVASIPGAVETTVEQVTGSPLLEIRVDQDAIARHGVPAEHVLEMVAALGEVKVGEIREGQQRYDLTLELADHFRSDPDAIGGILVPTAGQRIPLSRLAHVVETEGPAVINRDWGKRRVVVQTNVRGRDLGGFVKEARQRIGEDIRIPAGYYVTFGGQFEHLERATVRLYLIIPMVIGLILLLLYFSIGELRDALIVLTGVPFAATGGILALWARGLDFTISAAVGFIAVSGVAMLTGLVLVSTIRQRIAEGMPVDDAIQQTRIMRLRPILMTALVAALGFVPMALNTGVGAEVQRPLATVVIGGILADNLLTLFVLPALYSLYGAHRRGRSADAAV
jgi:cobalt-zinc-cadmium resistance protein CzcA